MDPSAGRILDQLGYDITLIDPDKNRGNQLAWAARAYNLDAEISNFASIYAEITIINLGCGLDTTFERVNNKNILWYEIDLPVVIELRRRFLPESGKRMFISGSVLDEKTFHRVKSKGMVLIVAAGLLYYFTASEVKEFLKMMWNNFHGSDIIFDVCSPEGPRLANKRVIAENKMEAGSELKWAMKHPSEILNWNIPYSLVDYYPLFAKVRYKVERSMFLTALISDWMKIMCMVHLKL